MNVDHVRLMRLVEGHCSMHNNGKVCPGHVQGRRSRARTSSVCPCAFWDAEISLRNPEHDKCDQVRSRFAIALASSDLRLAFDLHLLLDRA
eukprot:scaffold14454_cov18-Tisochrysis_lutea.AAC.3